MGLNSIRDSYFTSALKPNIKINYDDVQYALNILEQSRQPSSNTIEQLSNDIDKKQLSTDIDKKQLLVNTNKKQLVIDVSKKSIKKIEINKEKTRIPTIPIRQSDRYIIKKKIQ